MLFLVGSLFVGAGVLLYLTKPPERDEDTLCIASLPAHHIILLIDKTDAWSRKETTSLQQLIFGIRDRIPKDGKLSIFVFNGPVEPGFEPRFSLCSPGRGEETNWLWGNPRRVQKKFVEAFGEPLNAILDELITPSHGDYSPIREIMGDILQRREFSRKVAKRELIAVSDMVQNTDEWDFYERIPGDGQIDSFAKHPGLFRFDGVAVKVREVRRQHGVDFRRSVQGFWRKLFNQLGASVDWRWL